MTPITTNNIVLVVDDDPINRELLVAYLQNVPCTVIEACDGEEALAAVVDGAPDVILLDIMMPRLDGYEVTRRLKADPLTAMIPIVLVTALGDRADRLRGLEAGADEFLSKPIDRAELVARVRTLLRLKQLRQDELAQRDAATHRAVLSALPAHVAALDADGAIIAVNAPWERVAVAPRAGALIGGAVGDNYLAVCHAAAHTSTRAAIEAVSGLRAVLAGERDQFSTEYACELQGATHWFVLYLTRLNTEQGGAVVSHIDITARKHAEAALEHQARHDPLTGLPNRVLLHEHLRQALSARHRTGTCPGLMVMDLDRFKEVNDVLGHHAGDELLRQVGSRLRTVLRESDVVARLGGDEFAVLLPHTDLGGAVGAARKALQVLEAPFVVEGNSLVIGTSIGIALAPEGDADPPMLLRRADVAMYVAKRAGGGYALYDSTLDAQDPNRLSLVSELREAIEGESLTLHYQPSIRLSDGAVVGFEALVRWPRHPHGLLLPEQFIMIAEQTGLINPLGLWVLNSALRQCRAWDDAGLDLHVAVNLSMRGLHDPALPSIVASLLDTWGVAASRLVLEITETAVMADPSQTMATLTHLRAMGIRIAMDDFGTGYSSLSYLQCLPVDLLKIDRSFLKNVATSESDATIVRSVIDLGHNLGLTVVAEGVEDEAAWRLLQRLGCDYAQGFWFSQALPSQEIGEWLDTWDPATMRRLTLARAI